MSPWVCPGQALEFKVQQWTICKRLCLFVALTFFQWNPFHELPPLFAWMRSVPVLSLGCRYDKFFWVYRRGNLRFKKVKYCIQHYKTRTWSSWDSHPGIGIHNLCSEYIVSLNSWCSLPLRLHSSCILCLRKLQVMSLPKSHIWDFDLGFHQFPLLVFPCVSFTHAKHTHIPELMPPVPLDDLLHMSSGDLEGRKFFVKMAGLSFTNEENLVFLGCSCHFHTGDDISACYVINFEIQLGSLVHICRFFFYPSLTDFIVFW